MNDQEINKLVEAHKLIHESIMILLSKGFTLLKDECAKSVPQVPDDPGTGEISFAGVNKVYERKIKPMEKQIKDQETVKSHLHFYTGCDCVVYYISGDVKTTVIDWLVVNWLENRVVQKVLPILRRLRDLETKELSELGWIENPNGFERLRLSVTEKFTADEFTYLLSIGIDLFGLIDRGLAIDRQEIK